MNNSIVREYTNVDFSNVVDLMTSLQSYFKEIDTSGEKINFENRQSAEEYIRKALKDVEEMNGKIFVAEFENKIVGFIEGVIIGHRDDDLYNLTHMKNIGGWIGLLFVDTSFRSKGIAQSLIGKMREYFKKNNCSSMKLKVDSENKLAINVYIKYGFTPRDLEMTVRI